MAGWVMGGWMGGWMDGRWWVVGGWMNGCRSAHDSMGRNLGCKEGLHKLFIEGECLRAVVE